MMELFWMSVADVGELTGLRRALGGWLERCGVPVKASFSLRLGVHEAALLALTAKPQSEMVEVRAVAERGRIMAEIGSARSGSWDLGPVRDEREPVQSAALIRSIVDQVEVVTHPATETLRLRVPVDEPGEARREAIARS